MAELEDVTLDGKPLNSLRVADLKTALEKRGLPKSGQKNALVKRLKGALMLENLQKTSTPHIGLQPNSQIGAEMSQNSFIQQYLAKQQELLRQRLEREANDAVDKEGMDSLAGGEDEDNTEANDNSSYRPEHSVIPSRPSLIEPQEVRGQDQDGPPRAVASLSVRVVGEPERQAPAGHMSQLQESQSTPYAAAGSAPSVLQHSRFAQQAVSQSVKEDSDDDDDDDDESEEEEEWGPAAGKRGGGRKAAATAAAAAVAAQFLPTPQRSRRKLQPPQHIPPQPAIQPPLQLRQPTPPPSPPLELSFPLPDTPKQSPPDLNQAAVAVAEGPPAGLQRQDSSSSSRSSSPEPPAKLGRGPLSLLVRKMESEGFEGAFEEESAAAAAAAAAAGQKEGAPAAAPGPVMFHGDAHSSGDKMVSPGSQPVSLPHGLDAVPTITFSSGAPKRGVITTLANMETEHVQGPSEDEKRKDEEAAKADKDKLEDSHGQQTSLTTFQPLFDASLPTSPPGTTASSPPPSATKRRTFSDVPPPKALLSPTKSEPTCSDTSASPQPPAAHRGSILFTGSHQQTAQPPVTESTADTAMPKQAGRRQPSEGTAQAASLLPPSPPPDDTEAERKGRGKEQGSKRRSSASSDSSSSDSDSSGSSDSEDKSSSVSQKKGKQDQRRSDGKGDGSEHTHREVKESALSESADPAAMETMEGVLDRPGPQGQTDTRAEPEPNEEFSDKSASAKGIPTRKISLSTSKSPGGAESGSAETESPGGASRKRRWGSITSVTAKKPSISITTDSLKSLIPDIKTSEEAVVELHPEDVCLSGEEESAERQDREPDRDLKIRRTVTQVVPSEDQENGQIELDEEEDEEAKENEGKRARLDDGADISLDTMEKHGGFLNQDAEAKKVTPSDSVTRRSFSQQKSGVSITIDDPVQVSKQPSPPRGKISKIVHVRNLVRPFTLGQLKELLGRTGTMVEEGFWIDKIKSHCFVTYSTTEEAVATRAALHGVKWPLSNPKVLNVDFCEQDELDFHKGLKPDWTPEGSGQQQAPGPGAGVRATGPPPLMGNLERGQAGTGNVRDQWAEREREMQRRERTRSEREWDRDKVREFGKVGEERDGRRSRSRERRRRERGKSQERKTEKKEEEKKAAEEPPAKLLDDLFRKTKAAPCIYWLPLSDEQSVQRDQQRVERRKERERRQKEMEEEEKKQQEEKKDRGTQGRNRDGGGGGPGGGGGGGGGGAAATASTTTGATASRPGERDRPRDKERERDRERERERDSERDRGRDGREGREGRDSDRRRDSYRSQGAEPRRSGGAGASRRSRSRSNPFRDRRH
ncbi:apoptotic chromatin condensation inducer 1b isoform X2 [Alosa sapidissima]|uniref:apoptotic chromatin condensation inducer 1b isoform X2 n=1 Tax=Alosa sapidissima TaxID=34773 RepID=UPI001C096B57|nr:apoptotic chromatin condensation inducer 1b isoform X2 [Alosa sapidissima]